MQGKGRKGGCPARVTLRYALLRAAPAAAAARWGRGNRRGRRVAAGRGVRPGGRGEKGLLDFLYVSQPRLIWGTCVLACL